jgi:hypothetical protein
MAIPLTAANIQKELVSRKFPCLLDNDGMAAVITEALRQLAAYKPVTKFATLPIIRDIQDYYIFTPAQSYNAMGEPIFEIDGITPVLEDSAVCPEDTLAVTNVYWNPSGDTASINIFSPSWQLLGEVINNGSYFHQLSQMLILRQKLDGWRRAFGNQGFDLYGDSGDAGAYLRIYPIPEVERTLGVIEYIAPHSLATLPALDSNKRIMRWFMQWIEAEYAGACARYYSQTAGIQLLGFTDSKAAMTYWETREQKLTTRAIDAQGGIQGEAERT